MRNFILLLFLFCIQAHANMLATERESLSIGGQKILDTSGLTELATFGNAASSPLYMGFSKDEGITETATAYLVTGNGFEIKAISGYSPNLGAVRSFQLFTGDSPTAFDTSSAPSGILTRYHGTSHDLADIILPASAPTNAAPAMVFPLKAIVPSGKYFGVLMSEGATSGNIIIKIWGKQL